MTAGKDLTLRSRSMKLETQGGYVEITESGEIKIMGQQLVLEGETIKMMTNLTELA